MANSNNNSIWDKYWNHLTGQNEPDGSGRSAIAGGETVTSDEGGGSSSFDGSDMSGAPGGFTPTDIRAAADQANQLGQDLFARYVLSGQQPSPMIRADDIARLNDLQPKLAAISDGSLATADKVGEDLAGHVQGATRFLNQAATSAGLASHSPSPSASGTSQDGSAANTSIRTDFEPVPDFEQFGLSSGAAEGVTTPTNQPIANIQGIPLKPGVPAPSAALTEMLQCIQSQCPDIIDRITPTTDSHPITDPHGRNLAVDVTTKSPEQVMQCAANCGAAYQQNEYDHPSPHATAPHVHLQLVPGRGGAVGPYFAPPRPKPRPDF